MDPSSITVLPSTCPHDAGEAQMLSLCHLVDCAARHMANTQRSLGAAVALLQTTLQPGLKTPRRSVSRGGVVMRLSIFCVVLS